MSLFREVPSGFRAGFACFVGRPNTGKSTLTNALVGTKVAITSNKPQTTRHTIRGVVHRDDHQLIVVDTPGLHRPRTLLGSRLNDLVASTLSEVDVIGFCLPANEKIGPGDRYIAEQLEMIARKTPVVAIVTKTDTVPKGQVVEALTAVNELGDFAEVVPVSAVDGFQVDTVDQVLASYLPESPPLYPDGDITDEPESVLIAELVREAARRAPALAGRPGRRNDSTRRPSRGQASCGCTRQLVRGTRQPEGHHYWSERCSAQTDRFTGPAGN